MTDASQLLTQLLPRPRLLSSPGGARSFTMHVVPSGLGGAFSWTNCCCSVSGSGYAFSVSCRAGCDCGGCETTGFFGYEGFSLPATGCWCGCGDPDRPDPNQGDETPPVGVDVSFAKPVIFLEDEYENAPGETVPWQSTTTELRCTAVGGENGGHVAFELSEVTNLVQMSGLPFPLERDLSPGEAFCFTNVYKAVAASGRAEDIVATGHFYETDSGWYETSVDKATAVRVEIEPQASVGEFFHRHIWGVGELINCTLKPFLPSVSFSATIGSISEDNVYTCPLTNCISPIVVSSGNVSYTPATSVILPVSIVAREAVEIPFQLPSGVPGGAGFYMDLHILPDTVSFRNLSFVEVADENHEHSVVSGYFTNDVFSAVWYHTSERCAGEWHNIANENYWFTDQAAMGDALPLPDVAGHLVWQIPVRWRHKDSLDEQNGFIGIFNQTFEMSSNGCLRVSKHELWVERNIDGTRNRSEGVSQGAYP